MGLDISQLQPIPERNNVAFRDLKTVLANQKTPIVLRGFVAHWPLVAKAQKSALAALNYLDQHSTQEPVTVFNVAPNAAGRVFYNESSTGFNYRVLNGPFSRLAKQLGTPNSEALGAFYLGSTLFGRWFPEIDAEHSTVLDEKSPLKSLWLGQKSKVAIHSDFPLNLACNVIGKRRFVLFPPEQISNLYIGSLDFTPAGRPISMVNLNEPDFDAFPRFAEALKHAQCVDLSPGDCLFIPSMWWHYVEGLEEINAQINYWWREEQSVIGSPTDALTHALLAIRQLPSHEKEAWKAFFDYYLFSDEFDTNHIPNELLGVFDRSNTQQQLNVKKQLAKNLGR
ncbi:cupin-like domain-containing protein [Pseudoalteromonas xiamenensis]|uniref:cupin-like domain-containing protein n=1 Tax=Pseudoalteromonas xiamenensis TaxID=882626 RepID=UPI0027E5AC63|nr:cupin-like domain-containing protein [Pseudoalteromonas xiamenensis]WMN59998.1 cupin-like domain-containing protein [Pseudoalteromonas xiamenensis]